MLFKSENKTKTFLNIFTHSGNRQTDMFWYFGNRAIIYIGIKTDVTDSSTAVLFALVHSGFVEIFLFSCVLLEF